MNHNVQLILGTMTFGQQVFDEEAVEMVQKYLSYGYNELDTAYVYNEGDCELLLGRILKKFPDENISVSTKVNPRISGKLDRTSIVSQFSESLHRMDIDSVKTLYLHFPDPATPLEETLETCNDLYCKELFQEFGLSNFSAEDVEKIVHLCEENGWIIPTVYQGVYNAFSRRVEASLFSIVRKYGMRYYAYNPLAGGILTGRYDNSTSAPTTGRFTFRPNYQNRYWKESYFTGLNIVREQCFKHDIPLAEAALRWLVFHSEMIKSKDNGILIGASKMSHLEQNIQSISKGKLPEDVVEAYNQAWNLCKDDSPEYYRLANKK